MSRQLRKPNKCQWSDICNLSDTCFVLFMDSRKATMFTKIAKNKIEQAIGLFYSFIFLDRLLIIERYVQFPFYHPNVVQGP
jgi:hypothetical protein